MKPFIFILIALTWTAPGYATVDPDTDQIGVYFDTEAEVTCYPGYSGDPIYVYVIITNPSFPDILGVSFSFCMDTGGNDFDVVLQESWTPGCGPGIEPVEIDPCLNGWIRPCDPEPSPSGTAFLVTTYRLRLFGDFPVDFYLGPAPDDFDNDGMPRYVRHDGNDYVSRPLGVSSGDFALPVATIGGDCPVAVDEATFERVKCWYR